MVKLNEALVLARSRATDLENVRKFNCWGSDLTDVRIIRRMPNVQVLSLSVNKISTLADFSHCKNLEELYIRKNNILELNEICYLKCLPRLRILWLSDNPCANETKYRMTVLKHLPNIQKLDNIVVEQEEVNAAIEQGEGLLPPQAPTESLDIKPARDVLPSASPALADNASRPDIVSASMPVFSVLRHVTHDNGTGDGAASAQASDVEHKNGAKPIENSIHVKQEPEDNLGAYGGAVGGAEENTENPDTLSWEETNKIRVQLGLKPLSVEKVTQMKPRTSSTSHSAKARNANLLQAVLHLVKELDTESLEVVADAIRNRLDSL